MGYWVLEFNVNGGAFAAFKTGKIKRFEWSQGIPLAKKFPKNATVQFDPKYADRRTVLDFLDNSLGIPIVSSRVHAILEELGAKDIEWLPVKVKDHKGNPFPDPYYVLNPQGGQDVIDMEKSKYELSDLIPDQIFTIQKLVLDPKGVEKGARVFRANRNRRLILVDDDVKKAFKKEGITGCGLIKAEGWDGLRVGEMLNEA